MSWYKDHEYKYILHVNDHFTRFSWGYSMKTNTSLEVASNLFELFTIFGTPVILQSENGKEFISNVIKDLVTIWPNTKIINGHSQSQGCSNNFLKTKLRKWMEDNKRNDWTLGLKVIIHDMNTSLSRPIESTPYYMVFGTNPRNKDSTLNTLFSNGYVDEENIPEDVFIEGNECHIIKFDTNTNFVNAF